MEFATKFNRSSDPGVRWFVLRERNFRNSVFIGETRGRYGSLDNSLIKRIDCLYDLRKLIICTLFSKCRLEEWLDLRAVGGLKGSLHLLNLSISCAIVRRVTECRG